MSKIRKQNLGAFVRALRREAVSYGNRLGIIKGVRKRLGLDGRDVKGKRGSVGWDGVSDFSAVDAEARQLRIEWFDGRTGRVVTNGDGEIEKCVVFGEEGRDRITARALLSGGARIEDLGRKLIEG